MGKSCGSGALTRPSWNAICGRARTRKAAYTATTAYFSNGYRGTASRRSTGGHS